MLDANGTYNPAPAGARVLHVIAHLEKGGAERQLRLLVARSRHRHLIAVPGCNAGILPGAVNAPVLRLEGLGPRIVYRQIRGAIRDHRVDVVQLWLPERLTIPAALAARAEDVRLISGDRRRPRRVLAGGLRDRLRYLPHSLSDVVVANHPILGGEARLRAVLGFGARQMVIPNGIEEAVKPTRFLRAPDRILFVGRLVRQKRVRDLIAAAPGLARLGIGGIEIVGNGPEAEALQAQAMLQTAMPIRFHGARPDWRTRFAPDRHIFVLPSEAEGMSNALFEAIAGGFVPLVAASAELAELLRDWPQPPATFRPRHPRDLVRAAWQLRAHPPDRLEAGLTSMQRQLGAFSAGRMVASYDALYDALTTASGAEIPWRGRAA